MYINTVRIFDMKHISETMFSYSCIDSQNENDTTELYFQCITYIYVRMFTE